MLPDFYTISCHRSPVSRVIQYLLVLRNARAFPLLPAALASVSFGFVLVRVRVIKVAVRGPNTEIRPFTTPEKAVYLKISVQKASSEKARVEFSTYDKRCSLRETNGPAVLIGARRLRIHFFLLKSMHASPSSETCLVVPCRVVLRSFR